MYTTALVHAILQMAKQLGSQLFVESKPGPLTNCSPQPLPLYFNKDIYLCAWQQFFRGQHLETRTTENVFVSCWVSGGADEAGAEQLDGPGDR